MKKTTINNLSDPMNIAFMEAKKAFNKNEVPVGAVVTDINGHILAKAYNLVESKQDPTAHAEILAITSASDSLGDWRLNKSSLYVTKEPCSMCAGAIVNSRISRVVFGVYDDDKGACGSLFQICGDKRLNSDTVIKGGVLEEQCSAILKEFFSARRDD